MRGVGLRVQVLGFTKGLCLHGDLGGIQTQCKASMATTHLKLP